MSTLKSLFDKNSKHPERSFVYSPLAPGEFRLLRLQGTRSSSEPLTCNLFTTPLSEAGVRFEALSYVWGHDNPNRRIHLNDSHFYIRSNLEAALRALANNLAREDQTGGPATKVLWIDAMCINQDDNTEKSIQVQKMRTI